MPILFRRPITPLLAQHAQRSFVAPKLLLKTTRVSSVGSRTIISTMFWACVKQIRSECDCVPLLMLLQMGVSPIREGIIQLKKGDLSHIF